MTIAVGSGSTLDVGKSLGSRLLIPTTPGSLLAAESPLLLKETEDAIDVLRSESEHTVALVEHISSLPDEYRFALLASNYLLGNSHDRHLAFLRDQCEMLLHMDDTSNVSHDLLLSVGSNIDATRLQLACALWPSFDVSMMQFMASLAPDSLKPPRVVTNKASLDELVMQAQTIVPKIDEAFLRDLLQEHVVL